jgi:hypothetical protein
MIEMTSWGLLLSINIKSLLFISPLVGCFPCDCHWSCYMELHSYSGINAIKGSTPPRSFCTITLLTFPICLCFTYYFKTQHNPTTFTDTSTVLRMITHTGLIHVRWSLTWVQVACKPHIKTSLISWRTGDTEQDQIINHALNWKS